MTKSKQDTIEAWWFMPSEKQLGYGDNRKPRVGVTHSVTNTQAISCCSHGLHASVNPLDALGYAFSSTIYRVELSGIMDIGDDKIAAEHRKYIQRIDATHLLRKFARQCALVNIEKIKPYCDDNKYECVLEFLNSDKPNDELRRAAHSAAYSAAHSAAYSAAHSAAAAAYSAAHSAAAAAHSAAYSAAHSAAYSAAYSVAREHQSKLLSTMLNNE